MTALAALSAAAGIAASGVSEIAEASPAEADTAPAARESGSLGANGFASSTIEPGSLTGSLGEDMNSLPEGFDLQAHRGGIGLNTESSPFSFGEAIRLGVTTLELDTQVTRDGKVVVSHDRKTNPAVCTDTAPAVGGDPQFPYVGKFVKDLTLAQLRTLDCGSARKDGFPEQQTHPGSKIMLLSEVFDLVRESGNRSIRFNIETKVEAGAPEETAPREEFIRAVHELIEASGMAARVSIQSFDWGALMAYHRLSPGTPLVALTNGDFLEAGEEGKSPWLGGLDVDDFGDSATQPALAGVAAAASIEGVEAYSPVDTTPQSCDLDTEGCSPYTTPELVDRAHELGLKVVPWTVDHPASMEYMLDAGVDGMITDYPDVLLGILEGLSIELARA
ncbi:glycerophosphodiester phosphodiesterase family protein [Dietzia sp.]|uniref:glycerophosphodiester phosphodiesterase family protein n=1 Tax=Dietzia sp. TaxID=1871616 RepID=UPI002FDB74D4